MTTYTGTIERILYQNPDNAWASIILNTEQGYRRAAGVMPGLRTGMSARLTGEMESTKWGDSLKTTEFEEIEPNDIEGIEKYLASGLIRNIGPKLAKDIVSAFGVATLHVLDNEPERLAEVYGIGKKRVQSIIASVKEQKGIREVMIWLKRYDLPNGIAAKIYKAYGNDSITKLEENPYRLSDDIHGVGFKKADHVAIQLGTAPDAPFRIDSGLHACLEDASSDGNTCLPLDELLQKAASNDYLGLPVEQVEQTLRSAGCDIALNNGMAFLPVYYYAELSIAKHLRRLQDAGNGNDIRPDLKALEAETGIKYSQRQEEAIKVALTSKVSIITGGPGTGKTVTTNAIIKEFKNRELRVLLCAPTGRAAKRMNEVTGQEAQTIHRLLGYQQGNFEHNENFPLEGDALIVDEASMIDTCLMNNLVKALPDKMRLVIVGDVDQLPSVGAGCVLRDIIDSGCVPTTFLTDIYRQAQGSDIVMNAHAVNAGQMPVITNREGTDFWFFNAEDREKIADLIIDLVSRRIPNKLGYGPEKIQILSPMKRDYDPIGSTILNKRLQETINPHGEKIAARGETEFRIGDRIMQVKNDYDKGVFNGDLGTIVSKCDETDEERTLLVAEFDGQLTGYARSELQNIELAYACTIHKSQGSEYPVVIMPIHESQWIMLKRNLLYTGITRAKKECILVGTRKAIAIACQNEDTRKRYTMLKERLLTA